jgi:large subunit ribosomal protein L17
MRHRVRHRRFNRTSEHRKALRRSLAQNLIEHGQIRTTLPKAKDVRTFIEKLITLAVKVRRCANADDPAGSLRARRRIDTLLGDRAIIPTAHRDDYNAMSDAGRLRTLRTPSGRRHRTGEPKGRLTFTADSVTRRLIETVAPRYLDRPGGYTRVVRLPDRRVGDQTNLALLQLVGDEEGPGAVTKPEKTARRRRADARYALAVSALKKGGKSKSSKKTEEAAEPEAKPE